MRGMARKPTAVRRVYRVASSGIIILSFALGCGSPTEPLREGQELEVHGTVVSASDGNPIKGARVLLLPPPPASRFFTALLVPPTFTDTQGSYRLRWTNSEGACGNPGPYYGPPAQPGSHRFRL